VPRVAPEGEQRVGRGAEEQRVEHARIALREGVEGVGQGEDHVKVRNRQEVRLPRYEPPLFRDRLTRRAMAIAAALDRAERDGLDLGEPVRALKRVPVRTHDVRQLKPWRRD